MKTKSTLRRFIRPAIVATIVTASMYSCVEMVKDARAEAVDACVELAPSQRVGRLYCPGNPYELIELWRD